MTAWLFFLTLVLFSTYRFSQALLLQLTPSFDQRMAGNWYHVAMAGKGEERIISTGDFRLTYQPPDKVEVFRRVPDGSGCADLVHQLNVSGPSEALYTFDAGERVVLWREEIDPNSFLILYVYTGGEGTAYLFGRKHQVPDIAWRTFFGILHDWNLSRDDIKYLHTEEKCPLPGSEGEKIGPLPPGVPPNSTT